MIRLNEFSKYFRGAWLMGESALCLVNAEAPSALQNPGRETVPTHRSIEQYKVKQQCPKKRSSEGL